MSKTKRLLISMLTLLCCTGVWATGELNGLFTINASGDKVQFSKGNLQYFCSTSAPEWRFAEHQYDYVAFDISAYAANSEKWIDLFAHGTSGYNNGQTNYQPYVVGAESNTYYQGNLTGNADWGYNAISNGGNTENIGWRTLTRDEWLYVFSGRSNAASKYGHGSINGTNGMILLPDSWTLPDGLSFTSGNRAYAANSYTLEQWSLMENAGAVFLPASGSCNSVGIPSESTQNWRGFYRASTAAYYVYFKNSVLENCEVGYYYQFGDAVRLVKDYQLQQDAEGNYLLGSADDWKLFATLVNSGTNPAANAKMTADIDLGDDQTHIGDNNNLSYAYRGVFDGQGHKLNVNYSSTSSATTVEGGYSIAPFRNINGATIKNLAVTGNITGYMHCAGVVGYAVSPSTNLINNVTVSANITILNTHGGGFIGHNANATTTIQDCLFNGTINGKSGGSTVGVFFGWSESATMSLINCLENGSYTNCSTFTPTSCPGYAVSTVTNCYYAVSGSYPGTHATSAQLADGTTSKALQNGRAEEIWVQDPLTNQPMLAVFAGKYTVPTSGLGTFSAKANFTLPEGLEAYYCKNYDASAGTIAVIAINGVVPAETGVLLKGTAGETYTLTGTNNEAATVTDNALIAVTEQTTIQQTDGDYTNFGLSGGTFKKVNTAGGTVGANRAYLHILTSALTSEALARGISLAWDDDATMIEDLTIDGKRNADGCYDLQGRRVENPVKGLYIVNGKKVIIK